MANTDRTDIIAEGLNAEGDMVESYFCENLMAKNTFKELIVPYFYEIVYPCSEDPSEGRDFVSAALLARAKDEFLQDPSACSRYQEFWFAKLSSLPEDEVQTMECRELVGQCCAVIEGNMTFTELASVDPGAMKKWVASKLNEDDIAPPYQVAYLDALPVLVPVAVPSPAPAPPAVPDLAPVITVPPRGPDAIEDAPRQIPQEKDSEFTMVGILILIGMIMIFLTVVLLIVKRRKRYLTAKDVDEAIAQSEIAHGGKDHGAGIKETATWEDKTFDDQDPDVEVNIWEDHPHVNVRSVSSVSYHTKEGDQRDMHNSATRESRLNQRYRFDLADSYRNDVMGTYGNDIFGPTQITVVPPYPMEETSDSEADSWAQTDGTVGSLDDDPRIETTSEIGEI